MNHLDGTVAGTKVEGIKVVWDTAVFKHGFEPQIISGISSSAMFSVPYALGIHNSKFRNKLNDFLNTFTLDTLFKKKPLNKKNNLSIRAVFRAITKKAAIGHLRIDEVLKSLISVKDFVLYQSQDKYANCIVMSVDFKTGNKVITSLKEVSYDEFILHCLASASVPIYSVPITINDMILYDGGVRGSSCAADVMRKYKPSCTLSVFSFPKQLVTENDGWLPINIFAVLKRLFDITLGEISENSRKEQEIVAKENKSTLYQTFLPKILKSEFDTNRERLNMLKTKAAAIIPFAKSNLVT